MWRTSIFELAEQRGWSQEELARQLGVSGSTLSRIKHGINGPGRKVVLAASALFGQSANILFWYDPEAPHEGAA